MYVLTPLAHETRINISLDSAEAVDGAPTAIQLVMRTMFDEELLAAAKVNRRC